MTQLPDAKTAITVAPAAAPCSPTARPWVLAATILASSMVFIDGTVVNLALPFLQQQFKAGASDVQWVVESYALFLAALLLVGGSAGDRFGRRRVFTSGVALFTLASLWCGLAGSGQQLIVARAVQGIGGAIRNLPGSIRFLIDETAAKYGIDYVLVDMSPSLGPVNQNLLATTDYFIVPLHPDYFSSMALSSLAQTLPRWQKWAKMARGLDVLANADYPFPEPKAQFIGAIIQKYRPRNGSAAQAFQKWIDRLQVGLREKLIPRLEEAGMLDLATFESKTGFEPWIPIMDVADFNSIIALSQEHQVPVYELTQAQTGQSGAVWKQTLASMGNFKNAFDLCAEHVFKLTA